MLTNFINILKAMDILSKPCFYFGKFILFLIFRNFHSIQSLQQKKKTRDYQKYEILLLRRPHSIRLKANAHAKLRTFQCSTFIKLNRKASKASNKWKLYVVFHQNLPFHRNLLGN